MKITFLNIYQGSVNRGAETFVYEIASRLSKKYEVLIYQGGQDKGSSSYKTIRIEQELNWTRKDSKSSLLRRFFMDYWSISIAIFTIKIISKLWKEKPDILIPLNGGWQPALIRIFTWIRGGKMVISGQAGMGWDDRNNLWSFPDAFVAISSKAKKWAKKANPFVQIEYIPNGVDLNKFKPEGKNMELALKRPIVICVGALIPTKRIDLVIRAVARTQMSLVVAGDGDQRKKLEKLGGDLLTNRFKLLKLSHEEMPMLYRAGDLFTLASEDYYAFEIVLVEAMASGLPVVANKDEIRKEIVGDAGILADPENISEYSDALETILQKKWGDEPRKQAKKFSWDKIAKQYEELFIELLK